MPVPILAIISESLKYDIVLWFCALELRVLVLLGEVFLLEVFRVLVVLLNRLMQLGEMHHVLMAAGLLKKFLKELRLADNFLGPDEVKVKEELVCVQCFKCQG